MSHFASPSFWTCYNALPDSVQKLADKNFTLLKADTSHPSVHFKKVGRFRCARVGRDYRALALEIEVGLLWIWIGNHSEYERMIAS